MPPLPENGRNALETTLSSPAVEIKVCTHRLCSSPADPHLSNSQYDRFGAWCRAQSRPKRCQTGTCLPVSGFKCKNTVGNCAALSKLRIAAPTCAISITPHFVGYYPCHDPTKTGDGVMGFQRITADPNVCGRKPCIRGLRFPVSRLLGLLAAGETPESILRSYPYLKAEDIREAGNTTTNGERNGFASHWRIRLITCTLRRRPVQSSTGLCKCPNPLLCPTAAPFRDVSTQERKGIWPRP